MMEAVRWVGFKNALMQPGYSQNCFFFATSSENLSWRDGYVLSLLLSFSANSISVWFLIWPIKCTCAKTQYINSEINQSCMVFTFVASHLMSVFKAINSDCLVWVEREKWRRESRANLRETRQVSWWGHRFISCCLLANLTRIPRRESKSSWSTHYDHSCACAITVNWNREREELVVSMKN